MMTQQASAVLSPAIIGTLTVRCPRCTGSLARNESECSLVCTECHFPMEFRGGVWHALPVERATYFARFIKDYEDVRRAEGRGSSHSRYYLNLPAVEGDESNAGQWRIRSTTYQFLSKQILPRIQSSSSQKACVLDIGAGNGWLSYRLAQRNFRPTAVDLLVNETDGLGAAIHYDAHLPESFLRVRAEYNRLPFCSGQFDAAIFNASFHYAENYEHTLKETLRCLRVGGLVVIADSPWYSHHESGEKMLVERRSLFFNRFGTFSDSIHSQEFLTDQRLEQLAERFHLSWERYNPYYGMRWSLRPLVAKLQNRREPSSFRVYIATKPA